MLKDDFVLYLASSGDEALSQIEFFKPDIVLLDVEMPGINGIQTCRQIRSNPRFRQSTIIFISANLDTNDRAQGYEAGGDDYITKPFHAIELKIKLKNFVRWQKEKEKRISLELKFQEHCTRLESTLKSRIHELDLAHSRLKYEEECRTAVENRLKSNEEKLRNVVNQSRDGIFVVQDNRFRYLNPRMVHLMGYSYGELMANPFTMPIHPDDRKKVADRHRRRLNGENVVRRYTFRLITRQKRIRWVELREATTMWWEGKPATLGFMSDVTEQIRIQEATIQTEKMISVSGLAAGIAHEINNPLAGIMQSVQNIIRRLDPFMQSNQKIASGNAIDLPKVHAYLKERNVLAMLQGIWTSGERVSQVVQNMLGFVKKNEADMVETNLNQLIDSTVGLLEKNEDLKYRFQVNFIEIRKEPDVNLPVVPCLKSEIQKVLVNILVNAIQSVSENRLVRPPIITIRSKTEKEMARIEIEDNGSGINIMTKRRIFEPFFSTRPVGEGQGIGLSISYMVVTHNHDGVMEVESDPEWGTRFIICLPLKRPILKQKDKNLMNVLSDLQ
jgi:PAS domain S-box-containing protein